jgi:hypothetical protein
MAITQSALAACVVKPLNKGAVYPETFDDAYKDWQKQNSGKGGAVCTSSLEQCMKALLMHNRPAAPEGSPDRRP